MILQVEDLIQVCFLFFVFLPLQKPLQQIYQKNSIEAISKNALQCYQLLCYHQAESLGKRVVASSIDVAQ